VSCVMESEQDFPQVIWTTRDVRGREIRYDSEAREHILDGHEEQMGSDIDAKVKHTIENGNPIYASADFPNRELYFSLGALPQYPKLYLSVVVEHNNEYGTVITAFPQRKIGGIDPEGLIYVKF
jgi:hypothetical protein